jgi:GNAT superfamily N-acetyltransferase
MENQNMNNILNDLSALSLISAIEGNLFAFVPAFSKWPGAEVHDDTEIAWSMTDIPFPVFNSIIRARLAPDRIDVVIESITAQATSRNVPLLWWTGPATQPANLGIHLERHGFFSEGKIPGMAVVLDNMNEHPSMPNGFTIQQVTDNETLKQWSQVCATGFGMPDFAGEGYYDLMCHVDQDTVRAYMGWLDGKPVATSLLYLGAGVAGIYNVATIPEARRKGIGARMTDLPLLEARAMGYKVGILHAFEMGEGVYRSIGFEEYCKIGQYVWLPEQMQSAG